MTDLLKKLVPAAALALFAGVAFAGMPNLTKSFGSGDIVWQTEQPTPEFCKKNPTDVRCKDKDK
jgi:hypothetical protein